MVRTVGDPFDDLLEGDISIKLIGFTQKSFFRKPRLPGLSVMPKKKAQSRSEPEKIAVMILMLTIIILVLRHFVYTWATGMGLGGVNVLAGGVNVSAMNLEEMTDRIHALEDSNKKKSTGIANIPGAAISRPDSMIVTFAGTVAEDALRPGHLIRGTWHRELSAKTFDGLQGLQALRMNNNTHMTTLPSNIFHKVPNLNTLHLDGNRIATLMPGIFTGLSKLNLLDLSGNSLRTVSPGVLSDTPNLHFLSLNSNSIENLPSGAFRGLSSLLKLSLNYNDLKTLPSGVFSSLTSLKVRSRVLRDSKIASCWLQLCCVCKRVDGALFSRGCDF